MEKSTLRLLLLMLGSLVATQAFYAGVVKRSSPHQNPDRAPSPDPLPPSEEGPEHDSAAAGPPSRRALREAGRVAREAVGEGCTAPVCVAAGSVTAWVQKLYQGISQLPTYTDVGNIIAYGDTAFPVLTSKKNEDDIVIMAGADIGEGRVLAAAHQEYATLVKSISPPGGSSALPSCRATVKGEKYRGKQSVTENGDTCLTWASRAADTGDDVVPVADENIEEMANYCRNPNGVRKKPWCYTADSWAYCDVPLCPGVKKECKTTEQGEDYLGTKAVTVTGKTCQAWSSQSPHSHVFKDGTWFPDNKFSDVQNFCRNPDSIKDRPWCYTTESGTEWEFCDLPRCPEPPACRSTMKGSEYQGNVNVTKAGVTCQAWAVTSPHSHSYTDINKFPDTTHAELGNHCRNPGASDDFPWCYTTDPNKRWDYCETPYCPGFTQVCRDTEKGKEYMGPVHTTVSGRTCQQWAAQTPHSHGFKDPSKFPDETIAAAENYCRNPDGEPSPWCYTEDSSKRWEYCDTPLCPEDKESYTFALNIRKWLSKDNYGGENNVCFLDSQGSLSCLDHPSVRVAIWGESPWAVTPELEAQLLAWVKNGGGLFYALTPKNWQDLTFGAVTPSFRDLPFYNVIEEAGMAFQNVKYTLDVKIAVPTSVATNSLVRLNLLYPAHQISKVNDIQKYPHWLATWKEYVDDGENEWMYPDLLDKICEIMVPVSKRLEPLMPWPKGALEYEEVKVAVNTDHQSMYKVYALLGENGKWKGINADKFPGDIPCPMSAQLESYVFEKSTKEGNTWPTGVYLLPGNEMTINVLSADNLQYKSFWIRIGCHTDELYSKTELYRFPEISRWVKLTKPSMTISHVFGGLVQVWSPSSSTPNYIKVQFTGVLPAPYFNLEDPVSIAEWETRKHAPGLWADISGKRQRFTVTADSVRDLTAQHLSDVMQAWDDVVLHDYLLKGTPEAKQSRQWATADIQISIGWMHSGWPIGMHLDKGTKTDAFVLKGDFKEQWGMFHEVGHNMQEGHWTFPGTGEVTTNIFSQFNMWRILGIDPLTDMTSTVNSDQFNAYLLNPTYKGVWEHAWPALLPYSQLATHFGYDCYHKVFKSYYTGTTPQTNQEEQDEWVRRWSEAVGYNLCPVYEFYSLPLSESMCKGLTHKPYLPDDIVTQNPNANTLVNMMLEKYPGTVRTVEVKPDCPPYTSA